MSASEPDPEGKRSILKELVFNQYQAILLAGVAAVSLLSASPLPLMIWAGTELALLPVLDSRPLRRLIGRRRSARARAAAESHRSRALAALDPAYRKRYAAMEQLCALIESNYQQLHGLSQAYLVEQRGKLDVILDGCVNRLLALQRYDAMLARRSEPAVRQQMQALERELGQPDQPERARAALEKNLELKRRLLDSLKEARGTMRALATELDSMTSLLEVLHQNSIAMQDPQAVSQELDVIARQSEDSERVVREMEALVRAGDTDWGEQAAPLERAKGADESLARRRDQARREKNR
jgi:hypothetical protein